LAIHERLMDEYHEAFKKLAAYWEQYRRFDLSGLGRNTHHQRLNKSKCV
jgi:hypothetical protein